MRLLLLSAICLADPVTEEDVIPILLRRCTVCHGLRRQENDLDLRSRASILLGGKSGPAMVEGKPGESLIIRKVRGGEMPPPRRLVEASVQPIEPAEIEVLERWIELGAPLAAPAWDANPAAGSSIRESDRSFWSFRPPRPAGPPAVRASDRVRNPIDAFILARLEAAGLSLHEEASRLTLLRRASIDLTGLPPEPDEVEAFLADPDPLAHEKLVDRLLASERYGERWGRHWLDLAGYADSEGKREQDLPRGSAWRYRDYVIRSLNADKPYDRFLLEQIAGDELADYESAPVITQEIHDNLVATGFLRMAPDSTWANITGFIQDRIEVIADEMDILGSAVMGLTIKCARCHDHKLDPIPQRDYYRLLDVFKGAYDEHDWLKPELSTLPAPLSSDTKGDRHLPHVTTEERRAWEARNAAIADPSRREPEPEIRALWDRGEPSPTYVYLRGDHHSPGPRVTPGVPSVLGGAAHFEVKPPWPGARKTGRRLAFARWLTHPDHPLTARVMVNRLWKHHFGAGIVRTTGNFGKAGAQPTHPELLDWLALELVRQGWSLKAMHRLIMTSSTYRQALPARRMEAEVLRDTLLLAADRLDPTRYGPPDAVKTRPDGVVVVEPSARSQGSTPKWRRSIYTQQMRKAIPTILESFDLPLMNPSCAERNESTVATQALHLLNDSWVRDLAASFAERVAREAGPDPERRILRASLIALGRSPTAEEAEIAVESLAGLSAQWEKDLASAVTPEPGAAALRGLSSFCHALFNSAAFLHVD